MRAKPAKHKPSVNKTAAKKRANKPAAKKPAKRAIEHAEAEVGRSLLAQALELPDDDLPRLVYADWLEEQGHPLAELIRVTCEAAKLTGAARDALDKRAAAIASKHRRTWIPDPELRKDAEFERGMYRRLFMRTSVYGSKAKQAELLPMVRLLGVKQTTMYKPFSRLGSCETLAWTSELTWIDCQLDDAKLAELVRSPHLSRLSSLALEKPRCTNEGLFALANSTALRRLRHLALHKPVYSNRYDVSGVLAVLEAHPLESLSLMGVNDLAIDELVASPAIGKLRRAAFDGNYTRTIAESPHFTALEELELQSLHNVDDKDVAPLLDNPALAKLTQVKLRLWDTSVFRRKPSPAMIGKLRARFGDGLIYKDH